MSETLDSTQNNAGQRPTFLTVLCILSFIASGIGLIAILLLVLAAGVVTAGVGGMSTSMSDDVSTAVTASWGYFIAALVLAVVGLIGVIQMWKLKKTGFYIYAITAVVGVILPMLFGMPFSTFGTVITVAFIAMYAANLKAMS